MTSNSHENGISELVMTFKHFFFVFVFFSCMVIDIQGGETSTFKNPATQILQLQKGWNLCALTIAPDADSIALLNNHGVCWGWKNGRFKLLDTFLPWQGFWMYSEENTKLNLTGEEASPTSLHPGWNLVGADSDIQENLSKDGWHAWHYDQIVTNEFMILLRPVWDTGFSNHQSSSQ